MRARTIPWVVASVSACAPDARDYARPLRIVAFVPSTS